MLHQLLRLWLGRIAGYVVVGAGLVLLLHLPGGVYYEVAGQVEVGGQTIDQLTIAFSSDLFWSEVREFGNQVRNGSLPYHGPNSELSAPPEDFVPRLKTSWRNTLLLLGYSAGTGTVLGVLLGALYAVRSRIPRVLGLIAATLGLSLPDFLVVMAGQALSVWHWRKFDINLWQVVADPYTLKGMILPVLALAAFPMGYMARITGAALDEIMLEDYIRTARAKGLPEARVILAHAFKNAVPKVLAGLPSLVSFTLSSLVIVERLTVWPGMAGLIFTVPTRLPFGPSAGTWGDITPQVVSAACLIFLAFFVLLEGLAQTVRLLFRGIEGVAP